MTLVVYSDTEPHPFDFAQFEERLRCGDLPMNVNEPMNMDRPVRRFSTTSVGHHVATFDRYIAVLHRIL
jgi:hypothetical protein